MVQIECTFWMMNTQSKATQRTNDTRIQLQLQLIQRLLSKSKHFLELLWDLCGNLRWLL